MYSKSTGCINLRIARGVSRYWCCDLFFMSRSFRCVIQEWEMG